jgi:hypothetical protein
VPSLEYLFHSEDDNLLPDDHRRTVLPSLENEHLLLGLHHDSVYTKGLPLPVPQKDWDFVEDGIILNPF